MKLKQFKNLILCCVSCGKHKQTYVNPDDASIIYPKGWFATFLDADSKNLESMKFVSIVTCSDKCWNNFLKENPWSNK